jgi:DNA-damage-inducible protein J
MATTNINIRIDSAVKAESQKLLAALGLDMSSAVNIFLRQTLRERALPFRISEAPINGGNARKISLEEAADLLYNDYANDKELTFLTALDCEDFYEAK